MNAQSLIDIFRPALQEMFLFPVLRFYASKFRIEGLNKLAGIKGPVVFVANHSSHADTAIILMALPLRLKRNLVVAAAADYFYTNKLVGSVVSLLMNTFAFERKNPRKGMRKAKECLKQGNSLLIYPEGHRATPDEQICFKRGFASLACQFKLPVVPIAIEGSHQMLPKGKNWPQEAAIRISFGEPIYPCGQDSNELAHIAEEKVVALKRAA